MQTLTNNTSDVCESELALLHDTDIILARDSD